MKPARARFRRPRLGLIVGVVCALLSLFVWALGQLGDRAPDRQPESMEAYHDLRHPEIGRPSDPDAVPGPGRLPARRLRIAPSTQPRNMPAAD
jgi:hypothetical protein